MLPRHFREFLNVYEALLRGILGSLSGPWGGPRKSWEGLGSQGTDAIKIGKQHDPAWKPEGTARTTRAARPSRSARTITTIWITRTTRTTGCEEEPPAEASTEQRFCGTFEWHLYHS